MFEIPVCFSFVFFVRCSKERENEAYFFYTLNAFFFWKRVKRSLNHSFLLLMRIRMLSILPHENKNNNGQVEIPKKQKVSYVWVSQGALGQLPSYRPHHHQTWVGDGVRTPSSQTPLANYNVLEQVTQGASRMANPP